MPTRAIRRYHRTVPALSFQRYTDLPLPPYRFIPGAGKPHPIRNSAGHSYHPPGERLADVEYKRARFWQQCEPYLYGCDLYNHGYWWEAHETWEGLWRHTQKDGAQRHFLQSLIQVAVCHLKIEMQNRRGAESLRRSSNRHFRYAIRRIPAGTYMGLDLAAWYQHVQRYVDHALAQKRPAHDPTNYPDIRLMTGN